MHAIGMTAFDHAAGDPGFAAAGVVIAIAVSALALWLAAGRAGPPLPAALAFGAAVAAMHFIDMAGAAPTARRR